MPDPLEIIERDGDLGAQRVRFSEADQMWHAGVPPKFRDERCSWPWILEHTEHQALRADLEWLSAWSRDSGVYTVTLQAPPGRGKTTVMAAAVRACLASGPRWRHWIDLSRDVTDTWGTGVSERELLRPYLTCRLLALDDFGKEATRLDGSSLKDWQLRLAHLIVNGRYQSKLPLILTTELTRREMAERLDYAVTSRLVEDGRWITWPKDVPDHRIGG